MPSLPRFGEVDETGAGGLGDDSEELRPQYWCPANGTANLFLFSEPLTGRRHVQVTPQRTRADWAQAIRWLVDERYPQAERIVLVVGNLNSHVASSLYERPADTDARHNRARVDVMRAAVFPDSVRLT